MHELVHCALSAMNVASLSLEQGPWYKGFDFVDPRVQSLLPLLQYDDRRIGVLALIVVCGIAVAAAVALVFVQPYSAYEKIFLCIFIFGVQPFLPIIIASYVKVSSLLDKWLSNKARDNQTVVESSDTMALVGNEKVNPAVSTQESLVFWIRLHEVSVTVAMTAALVVLHMPYESGGGYTGTYPFSVLILLYPLPFYGTGIARWRLAIPLIWVCTVMTLVPLSEGGAPWDFTATRHRKIIVTCWTGVAATGIYIGRQIGLRDALRDLIAVKQSIISLGKQRDDLELLVTSALPERVRTCAWEQTVKQKDGQNSMSTLAYLDVPSTVAFGDVVGFTNWCGKRSVMEIVSMLSSLFDELDRVAASLGICKVKTLGDAYWAVAGLVDGNPNHAGVAMEFALTLATEAGTRLQPLDLAGMRVGVHTGLVSGGLIGPASRKSFEVFGAANQIAEDVQTAGQPGRVLVTEATRSALVSSHHRRRYIFADGPTVTSLETLNCFFASYMELDLRSECAEETDSISERINLNPVPLTSPTSSLRLESLGMVPMPIVPQSEAGNAPPQQNWQSEILSIASAASVESILSEKRPLPSFSIPKPRLKLQAFLTMIDQEGDAATALQANTPTFLSLEVEQTAVERFTPLDEPLTHIAAGLQVLEEFSASRLGLAPSGSGRFRDNRRNVNPLEVHTPLREVSKAVHAPLHRKSLPLPMEVELEETTFQAHRPAASDSERDQNHGTDRLAFVYGMPLVLVGYPLALSIGDAIRFDPPSGICYIVAAMIATAGYITLLWGNWNFRVLYTAFFVPYYIVLVMADYFAMQIDGNFMSAILIPLIYVFWSLWIWIPWYLAAGLCLVCSAPLYVAKAVGWAAYDHEGYLTIVNGVTGALIVALGARSARLIADRSAEDKQVLSDAEAARKQEFKEMESTAKCLVPPFPSTGASAVAKRQAKFGEPTFAHGGPFGPRTQPGRCLLRRDPFRRAVDTDRLGFRPPFSEPTDNGAGRVHRGGQAVGVGFSRGTHQDDRRCCAARWSTAFQRR
jgi:class 3 adenylate cyclase